ncbi:MAG TPA: M13 family metallopeptidase N-terminal domain-containing protein, partial [Gemmatimonadaceae bacterium]|nr:M13 family metallopeptidase N-terminal domain-containing protein [Gemmatimonadaceae bacterium]
MRRISRSCAFLAVAAAIAAPAGAQGTYRQTTPLDPANVDRMANACTDFYQFANGGWLKSNPLPAAYSSWGSFEELGEKNQEALTAILREAASTKGPAKSASYRMLGTYYSNCMDSAGLERQGAAPLQP